MICAASLGSASRPAIQRPGTAPGGPDRARGDGGARSAFATLTKPVTIRALAQGGRKTYRLGNTMSTVTEIIEAVERLSPAEFMRLRIRLAPLVEQLWHRQLKPLRANQRTARLTD